MNLHHARTVIVVVDVVVVVLVFCVVVLLVVTGVVVVVVVVVIVVVVLLVGVGVVGRVVRPSGHNGEAPSHGSLCSQSMGAPPDQQRQQQED